MGRLVPVKLRPDQYINQIRDIPMRRGGKAELIRSKNIIKYIKVKKLKRERVRPLTSLCIFVDETAVDEDKFGKNESHQIADAQGDLDIHRDSFRNKFPENKTTLNEVESPLHQTKKVDVHIKKLKLPIEESGEDEDVCNDSSLGLFLSDSDEEFISCPQNEAISNLLEDRSCFKRAVLLNSTARTEKCKFGYSKFELKHDTLNLDKHFSSRPRRIYRQRRLLPLKDTVIGTFKIEKDDGKSKNNVVELSEISTALDTSGKDVIEISPDGIGHDFEKLTEKDSENNNTEGMTSVKALEQVAIFNHEDDESGQEIEVGVNVVNVNMKDLLENGREDPKPDEVKDDVKLSDVHNAPDLSTVGNERAAILYEEPGEATSVAEDCELETGDSIADNHPVCEAEWCKTSRQTKIELGFKEWGIGAFNITSINTPVLRELLTPSELQFQGYLAGAVVTELEMQELHMSKIDTSDPDVIITEVDNVLDAENNDCNKAGKLESTNGDGTLKLDKVFHESFKVEEYCPESSKVDEDQKLLNRKEKDYDHISCQKTEDSIEMASTDDSDSDVVLLSDDETDLCCPTNESTIMYSWQVDILNQTWEEWPKPDKDIVLILCKETGLSSEKIKDWFEKKTEQELYRLWAEL